MTHPPGGPVPTYVLTVRLNRRPSDAEIETLRSQSEDVDVERADDTESLRFTRTAETLSVVIGEALDDVAKVPGLEVLWTEPGDRVVA